MLPVPDFLKTTPLFQGFRPYNLAKSPCARHRLRSPSSRGFEAVFIYQTLRVGFGLINQEILLREPLHSQMIIKVEITQMMQRYRELVLMRLDARLNMLVMQSYRSHRFKSYVALSFDADKTLKCWYLNTFPRVRAVSI